MNSQRTFSPIRPLIFGVILVIASFVLVIWNARWIISAALGPQPMTTAELRQVADPGARFNPWVTLTYEGFLETNVTMVSKKGGQETPTARFILIPVQDRWLIAEVPPNHGGNQVTGYLDTWWAPLRRESIQKIEASQPQHKGQFLSYQLDAVYHYGSQCIAMVAMAGIAFIVGLGLIGYGAVRLIRGR
jgi:hypothetical protein